MQGALLAFFLLAWIIRGQLFSRIHFRDREHMSNLRRIILLHAHLPGVVELQLDQHTNICGTNASGKTTLQRLIPVFYG